MNKLIRIGKEVDINTLIGVTYENFELQNRAQRVIARTFLKFKGTKKDKCIICRSKLIYLLSKILKIEFLNCRRYNQIFRKYYYNYNSLKNFFVNDNLLNIHSHKNQESYRSKYLSKSKVHRVQKFL